MSIGFKELNISKNLTDRDRQSVTSIGLGSLLLDQFNLDEELTNSLGLKFSVTSEFESDDPSKNGGSGTLAEQRLKSATKLKINKKISKKVNLSVSSTVGGSTGQGQEMNLDYKVKENFNTRAKFYKKRD